MSRSAKDDPTSGHPILRDLARNRSFAESEFRAPRQRSESAANTPSVVWLVELHQEAVCIVEEIVTRFQKHEAYFLLPVLLQVRAAASASCRWLMGHCLELMHLRTMYPGLGIPSHDAWEHQYPSYVGRGTQNSPAALTATIF